MSLAVADRVVFYSSNDLINWSRLSEFGGKPVEGAHGGVWECPDLLPFDYNGYKMWVLLVSINPGGPNLGSVTQYFVGDFDGKVFRKFGIDHNLWMDWGPDNYAGVTFSNDPKNRKLLVAWMNNWLYAEKVPTAAWRGQMTLPRVLQLKRINGKIRLASSPAKELQTLRIPLHFYEKTAPFVVKSDETYDLTKDLSFENNLLEIDATIDTTLNTLDRAAHFDICFSNSQSEELCVGYNYAQNSIYIDRSNSGTVAFNENFKDRALAYRETRSKIIELKIFLDVSAIELFTDGGVTTMTALFFPTELLTKIKISFKSAYSKNELSISSIVVQGLKSIYDC